MKRFILLLALVLLAGQAVGQWGRGIAGGEFDGGVVPKVPKLTIFTSSQGKFFVAGGDTTWIVPSDSLLMFLAEHGNKVQFGIDTSGTISAVEVTTPLYLIEVISSAANIYTGGLK